MLNALTKKFKHNRTKLSFSFPFSSVEWIFHNLSVENSGVSFYFNSLLYCYGRWEEYKCIYENIFVPLSIFLHSQPAHDVRTTLYGRRFNVLTSFQNPHDVVLKSCVSWVAAKKLNFVWIN